MIKPLSDRVVLVKLELEKRTASGIVLGDASKEKPHLGKVVAVGPGKIEQGVHVPLDIKEGDKVIYKPYAPTEVKLNGKEYLIVEAKDILAIIEGEV